MSFHNHILVTWFYNFISDNNMQVLMCKPHSHLLHTCCLQLMHEKCYEPITPTSSSVIIGVCFRFFIDPNFPCLRSPVSTPLAVGVCATEN